MSAFYPQDLKATGSSGLPVDGSDATSSGTLLFHRGTVGRDMPGTTQLMDPSERRIPVSWLLGPPESL